MQKVFLLVLLLSLVKLASAQSYYRSYDHHDISVSYGMFHPDQFQSAESGMLDERYPTKRYVRDEYSSMGSIFLTYRHMFRNELFLWGITAGLSNSSSKI